MPRRKKIVFQISAHEKEATASLRKLSARFQQLMRPIDKLNHKLRANQRALKPITDRLNRIGHKYKALGEKASLGITTPLTLAGVATAKVATDFETGMIKVKALTGSTSEEFLRMRNLAKSLGATTQFSAKEAAEGMSFLGMAGFKAKEIVKAIPGVMDLAAASQLELGEASDYASNILTAFGKKAGQMSEVSDKLTYAFTNSNTTLTELHNGLAKVGGVAVKAGVSFEDITASMMALADAGHKGETAGVALAGALSRITKFTIADEANEVTKTLAKLGIKRNEFLDGKTGKFNVRFQDFIKLLDEHGAQLSDYQKIFGQDAGKYIVGLSDNFEKLNGYLEGIKNNSEGLTKAIAKMYMSGTGGAFKLLISALEGLMVKLGDTGFLKVINASMRSLGHLLNSMTNLSSPTLKFGLILAGLTAVFGPFAFGVGLAVQSLKKLVVVLGLSNLAALKLGLITLGWGAAIAAAAYGIYFLFENFSLIWDKTKKGILQVGDAITYMAKKAMVDLKNLGISFLNLFRSSDNQVSYKLDPDIPRSLSSAKADKNFIPTEDFSLTILPRLAPLKQYEYKPKEREYRFVPEFISKGFSEVFKEPEGEMVSKYKHKTQAYDFYELKKQIIESKTLEKQQLDVNIKLDGANKDTQVEVRNRSKSRATVDTGRIMVGA